MLLAVVAALGWSAQQLYVVTAFLHAVLDNPQYAELPPGYEDTDSQTVNQLARAMTKPSKAHMAAAKHLLRYLAGTIDFCICLLYTSPSPRDS